MQAIARVNRVFKDKPGGLVVDYLGLADQLKRALADYTEASAQAGYASLVACRGRSLCPSSGIAQGRVLVIVPNSLEKNGLLLSPSL
jgi:hypothetical protein